MFAISKKISVRKNFSISRKISSIPKGCEMSLNNSLEQRKKFLEDALNATDNYE